MEHTYTKVSLLWIKKHLVLAAFATSLLVGAAHAKDIDESILLKQAILSLVEKNKALEARVKLLESNVFPQQDAKKGESKNPYAFVDLVKENIKHKKFTFGKATKVIVVRERPTTGSKAVFTLDAGSKVIVKNIAYSSTRHLWYELDEGLFVYGKNITFWSADK